MSLEGRSILSFNIPIRLYYMILIRNENCYYWPLHLVTGFHILIVPSILFHRSPPQKDICFLRGMSHCSEFFRVHIWANRGILSLQIS